MKPSYKKCKGCGRRIVTWSASRLHYGRMIKRGATKEQAKAASPRCQKCTTKWLREQGL